MKKVYTLILSIVALWAALVCFDAVRLLNGSRGSEPVFVLSEKSKETETGKKTIYYGPGYSVTYEYLENNGLYVTKDKGAVQGEFRLFGLILIWAWIV